MTWLLALRGHQHPWYWLCRTGKFCLTWGRISAICVMLIKRNDINCRYISCFVSTVKCHYNVCHYNANASLTRSILGSQTAPSWPSPSGSAHGLKVWNHRCLIGHSGNDTPLFPYKCSKTKVSHLLVMSIQSIHYWSSIKHTDYSSPVLRECHHQANMATRCPDVENNPGSNQVNLRYTQ